MKHADDQHAPPPIGKMPWSWFTTLWQATEEQMVQQIGMDATIFIRFIRMCRNIFLVLSVLGVAILAPVHIGEFNKIEKNAEWLLKMTPENTWASAQWSQVVVAYLFNIVVAGFLWWNYRKVAALRRTYFDSQEFQTSLHARTLMVGWNRLPAGACSSPLENAVLTCSYVIAIRYSQAGSLGRGHSSHH